MSSRLSELFRQARIPLHLPARPLRDSNPDIVQLDVTREPSERVRLWTGAASNQVEVLGLDSALAQLVLRVHEARRPYEERIRVRGGLVTRAQIEEFVREGGGGRVLHPRGSSWIVERFTEPAERRFLVGFDDGHLFAAQIPSGDTVREAHDALMPDAVRAAGQRVRQGEWFFVPTRPSEDADIRARLAQPWSRRSGRLPGAGEPHWAEELLTFVRPSELDPGLGPNRYFVRGRVRHRDHRTVCFDRWRRVYLNAAVRRRGEMARGFYWVD